MYERALRQTILAALVVACFMMIRTRPAEASGCSIPPCGALTNQTTTNIGVKWTDDDGVTWQYAVVTPGQTVGGFFNDGIDVDFWYIPPGYTDIGRVAGTPTILAGEQWAKISSDDTVVISRRNYGCTTPSSWPSTKSWINLWTTAIAHCGAANSSTAIGSNTTATNPQYIWCRKWGAVVSDSSGNYNHWWLWTDLDSGGRGWISAYYISGQGNDQADDMYTRNPIPNCP